MVPINPFSQIESCIIFQNCGAVSFYTLNQDLFRFNWVVNVLYILDQKFLPRVHYRGHIDQEGLLGIGFINKDINKPPYLKYKSPTQNINYCNLRGPPLVNPLAPFKWRTFKSIHW